MTPILGGLGLAAYGAANAWVDAYIDSLPGWRAINWEGWNRTSGSSTAFSESLAATQRQQMFSDDEVVTAFETVLRIRQSRRVVIVRGSLEKRIADWAKPPVVPLLCTPILPVTSAINAVKDIVASLLGVTPKPDDNLLEIGANSLVAVQLLARLRAVFKVNLPLRSLFECPTIAHIAQIVSGNAIPGVNQDSDIDRILDEIETLTDDEIQIALAREPRDGL
jgi:polyketide synthase PksJ